METKIIKKESLHVISVQFYESFVDCVIVNDTPHFIVKSVCEDIGLDIHSAYNRINSDEILKEVCCDHNTDNPKYMGKKVKCIPIHYLHGWLFGIETGKVKKEVRPILIKFKREVFQVLFDYFFGRVKNYDVNTKRRYEIIKRIKQIDQTINLLLLERQDLDSERKILMMSEFKQLDLWSEDDEKALNSELKKRDKLFGKITNGLHLIE